MTLKLWVVLVVIAAVAGCQHDSKKKAPTQKEQAVAEWNQARAGVLASLAKSQYETGNFEKSQQTANEALRLDPTNAGLHVLCGRLSIEQGQLEQADRELALARQFDPKNAEAEYLAGVVHQRWQKGELACEFYTRASEKNPAELAYLLARAESLVALDRPDEALAALRSKSDYFEHNSILHDAIGQILVSQEQYAQAVESLRQASVLAPDDPSIREHLAMACFFNHQYREAGEIFMRLVKDEPNAKRSDLWIALGESQMQTGRAGDARSSFETATQLNPASTAAWLSLAKAALQLGDTRRAELALRKVLSLDGSLPEAHLMLGYVRLRQNNLAQAMSEFQKSASLDSGDPVSLCMIGYVLEKTGRAEQALTYYAQALKIRPDNELATKLMASVDVEN